MKNLFATVIVTLLCAACQPTQNASTTPASAAAITLIVINDTYRADNLPYVRSLRTELEKTDGNVLVLHAGDFLFPSLQSQRYSGAQMIDAMNLLDGDATAHDQHLFVTFGNHEFDKSKREHAAMLQSRVNESQFDWLGSNIVFATAASGDKLVAAPNLVASKLLTVNGVKVGLVSATTDIKSAEYIERFLSPAETIREQTRQLRAQGAQLVIAVTHQTLTQDKDLLTQLGNDAPDLIAGGHEHERHDDIVNGRHIVKADADAASAVVVKMSLQQTALQTSVRFVAFPAHYTPDSALQQRVSNWQTRFEQESCADRKAAADCMQSVIGKTRVELTAEELTIRRFETNLGNLLADTARAAYSAQGAQIAFLNSGSMRLNYNIPPGNITRTHIDSLFAYPAPLTLINISGKQLQQVVDHAITDWTGNGHWLQISGFAFKHDPAANRASELSLVTPQGLRPIRADETLLAVTTDYLIDEKGDQDGFRMLGKAMTVKGQAPVDLKQELLKVLARDIDNSIAPVVDGRICNTQLATACILFR